MSSRSARLEVRIAPENKQLIERAAELTNRSLTTFVTEGLPLMSGDRRLGGYEPSGLVFAM